MRAACATIALICVLGLEARADDWWVDNGSPNCPGDGSPDKPFCLIQDAIDAAADGDIVWVKPGTYSESLAVLSKSIEIVGLEGLERTILSLANPILRIEDKSQLRIQGFSFDRGFHITGGGGIRAIRSDLTIIACRFIRCHVQSSYGGAIYSESSRLAMDSCEFLDNDCIYGTYGGAIYAISSEVIAEDCLFQGNVAGGGSRGSIGRGGAFAAMDSACSFKNCVFQSNSATYFARGGAIYLSGCQASITNSRIDNNCAFGNIGPTAGDGQGGGIYIEQTELRIIQCLISRNTVSVTGSGSARFGGLNHATEILSSVITNNHATINAGNLIDATAQGGGIGRVDRLSDSVVTGNSAQASAEVFATAAGGGVLSAGQVIRCTIADNKTAASAVVQPPTEGGGGIASAGGIQGSILWGNSPEQITSAGSVSYSNVQGGWSGVGNISADPMFLGPDDYRLACKSPCVDAGWVDDSEDLPLLDASGLNYRLIGPSVDMGAHETGLRWMPSLSRKGGQTLLAFEASAPVFDPKVVAYVFVSFGTSAGDDLVLPDGTGRRLGLVSDTAFRVWLALPAKYRSSSLRGCESGVTQPLPLPDSLPPGQRLYYAGFAQNQATGEFVSVSDVQILSLD